MKDEYPNFYLFLSDALRRDYFPNNQNNELPTKRANDMSSIGDEISINPEELM